MKMKSILYIIGFLFIIFIIGGDNNSKIENNLDNNASKDVIQQNIKAGEIDILNNENSLQNIDTETQIIADENKTTSTNNSSNENKGNVYYIVNRVVDGDTIEVNIDGKLEKIRLLGIDTPETVDPRKPVECFGIEASNKMKDLVNNKNIRLVSDKMNSDRDNYGRLLRYVYLEGEFFINSEMIKQGYAYAYLDYPFIYKNDFKNYESEAKTNKVGLWADGVCNSKPVVLDNTDIQAENAGLIDEPVKLQITDVFYDGVEGRTEPDEYVLIKNIGSADINMNDYTLQDESGKTFIFNNYNLKANKTIKIFTGCGTNFSNVLYWCYTKTAIWNNSGDTAYLKDKNGNLIDSYSY